MFCRLAIVLLRLGLVFCLALTGCRTEDSPAGVYVNNDAAADTLRLHPDGFAVRTAYDDGRRVEDEGTWELDPDGRHLWISGWRNRGGGSLPPEVGEEPGLGGLTIERDWRGRYARIYYSADEYAAFVRVE